CAGADLDDWYEANDAGDAADAETMNWVVYGHEMMERKVNFPKPLIAAVNGAAAGGGCDLTLAADIRFASTKAKFLEAYINVGYNPDNGGNYLLHRIVGWSKAAEMIYIGEAVKAHGGALVKNVKVTDRYADEAGKSVTVRITFADKTRTLTRDEVMVVANKVIADLAGKGIALKA
ncbi:MAG: enoyl-CoA hydratase/isomerase family protein, partial [Clostridia bacterium]|nr:enoyl-CoA hydratase/isomerase family protein [Clostridia bacterium]